MVHLLVFPFIHYQLVELEGEFHTFSFTYIDIQQYTTHSNGHTAELKQRITATPNINPVSSEVRYKKRFIGHQEE
jgi:hypothetical protein